MKHPDPQAQALALLRAELDHLQAGGIAPTEQVTIRRMIARRTELQAVFATIWNPAHVRPHHQRGGLVWLTEPLPGWADCYTPETFAHEVNQERRRLLQAIIGTAATVPGLATHRREALADLPELFKDFSKQAQALALTLQRITDKAERGGLALPGWLSDPIELMNEAAGATGPESFELIARPALEGLADRYALHLPDLHGLLEYLATATRPASDPRGYEFTRQSHPLGDHVRSLLQSLNRYWRAAVFLQAFEFTTKELLSLAVVMSDAHPDALPADPERFIRSILKAHRDA